MADPLFSESRSHELNRMLEIQYNQPHRFYHDKNHPRNVYYYSLEIYDKYLAEGAIKVTHHRKFFFETAAYHDIFYDVSREPTHNEQRSANFYRDNGRGTLGLKNLVCDTIVASADHTNAMNAKLPDLARIFLDADLYELGSFYEVFVDGYENIVKEYCSVFTLEEVQRGRLDWYKQMLAKPRIYWIATDREARARENMERHIKVIEHALNTK